MKILTFAHPWFLLTLLLIPLLAWLKGKRGQQSAFLYSSVQLIRPVANITRWGPGQILLALRWLVLAFLIIGLARPHGRGRRWFQTAQPASQPRHHRQRRPGKVHY